MFIYDETFYSPALNIDMWYRSLDNQWCSGKLKSAYRHFFADDIGDIERLQVGYESEYKNT